MLIGGTRVGYVGSISTAQTSDGTLYAVVHVKLGKSIEPLPADSTDLVRPVSPLGLEYLQIERGHSKLFSRLSDQGATVPMTQTQLPVQVDDIFKMFNAPTRAAQKENLNEFGDAFASRGTDLNDAFSQLQPLIVHVLAVTRQPERSPRHDSPMAVPKPRAVGAGGCARRRPRRRAVRRIG